MGRNFLITCCLLFLHLFCFAQNHSVSADDLRAIKGCWEGTLTYLDYHSGKPYTMPARLIISEEAEGMFIVQNIYPKEPKANSTDTLRLVNGTMINDETVISKYRNEQDELVIITERNGIDGNDNQPALLRHTYILSKTRYLRKKEVQFSGSSKWIQRNEFNYTATTCK